MFAGMSERPAKRRRFEGPCGIKFLLEAKILGSIIGKAGANVKEIMSETDAQISISNKGEFFPNTAEQVMLVCGDFQQNLSAIQLIVKSMASRAAFLPWGGVGCGYQQTLNSSFSAESPIFASKHSFESS